MTIRAGFIGLGNIGKPLAARLVPAGFETTVHDVGSQHQHGALDAKASSHQLPPSAKMLATQC